MSGDTGDTFFWSDWQSDPKLRACSFAAQGVWMRILCIMADSEEKGCLLINGIKPTIEELCDVIGKTPEMVGPLVDELGKWGVYSVDRRGVIYSRKMIKARKKVEASRKGGKKGGPVSLEKQTGIFSTRTPTRDATRGVTRHPIHSIPKKVSKKEGKPNHGLGKKNGEVNGSHVTIADPKERLARFQKTLAAALGKDGWLIVGAAADPALPDHARCLAICKAKATELGKGWPTLWPT